MVRACQWPFSAKPHTWKPFCPFCHADPCRVLKEKLQRKSYRPKDLCRWSILARQHLIWTHRMAHLKVLEAVNVLRIKLRFYSLHLSVREGISWWLSPRLLQFQSHILTYVSILENKAMSPWNMIYLFCCGAPSPRNVSEYTWCPIVWVSESHETVTNADTLSI